MLTQLKERSSPKNNGSLASGINLNPDYATIKCKKIGNYILSKTIGKGTFSKVKLGYHVPTQQKVAIKILDKAKIKDDKDLQRISREIKILKQLRHNNIAQLYETLTSDRHIYIIMEYIEGGDLFEYIFSQSRLNEAISAVLFKQLISVIEYIHKIGIVHRDIKPENILLNATHSDIKLVDFGLSNSYKQGSLLSTACGSPCYASPEMILGKQYNGLSSDLWSCGVVLYCMLIGKLPFDDEDIKVLYKKIITGTYFIPDYLSPQCNHFLNRLLEINPDKRISIPEILNHPFIANNSAEHIDKGIVIGTDEIKVDYRLVKEIKDLYCPSNKDITMDSIVSYLKSNNHNSITTMYYLSLNQRKKQIKAQLSQLKIERKKCDMFNLTNIKKINFEKKKKPKKKMTNDPNKEMNFVVINNFVSENNQKKNMNMNIRINKANITLNKNTNNNNNIHLMNIRNRNEDNNNNINTPKLSFSLNSNMTSSSNQSNCVHNIEGKSKAVNNTISSSIGRANKDNHNSTSPSKLNAYQKTFDNDRKVRQKLASKRLKAKDNFNISANIDLHQNKVLTLKNGNEKTNSHKKSLSNKKAEIAKLKDDFKEILMKYRNKSQGKEEGKNLPSQSPNRIPNRENQMLMKKIFKEERSNDLSNISILTNNKIPLPYPHAAQLNQKRNLKLTIPTTKARINNHSLNKNDNNNWNLNTSMSYERSHSKQQKTNQQDELNTLSSFQKIIQTWEECKKKSGLLKPKHYRINTELSSFNDNSISFI